MKMKSGREKFFPSVLAEDRMPVLLMKTMLSMVLLLPVVVSMATMFELFGRIEKKYNVERLKRIHRISGIVYIVLYLVITYYCLKFIVDTKTELSPRASLHSIFAFSIAVLLAVKIIFVRVYKKYYPLAQTFGLWIALITFGMVWTSGAYYLLVTEMGTAKGVRHYLESGGKGRQPAAGGKGLSISTDSESIQKGKELFQAKCSTCHDPNSTATIIGPGLKGVLKKEHLPVSKKPATPENIEHQLRSPFSDMPSFDYLSRQDVGNLLAFLNTL